MHMLCTADFDWCDMLRLNLTTSCDDDASFDNHCLDSFAKLDPHSPNLDPNALMSTVIVLIHALSCGKPKC